MLLQQHEKWDLQSGPTRCNSKKSKKRVATACKSKKTPTDVFDKYGPNNCLIELVEDYPCENEIGLRIREAFYILNNPCVNKHIPNRSQKEYCEANRDTILHSKQQYYKANRDAILKKRKLTYQQKKYLINAFFIISFIAFIMVSLKLVS